MGDVVHYASVSGGKDSLAMCLHLQDLGIEFRPIFFDTGWEHADTYAYLTDLETRIGEIRRLSNEPTLPDDLEPYAVELETMLGHRSPLVRWVLKKGMFPSRVRRFCTQELKIRCVQQVMREAHDAGELPVNVIGIRSRESAARAKLSERELDPAMDCMVWRPIIDWTEQEVIDRIKAAGLAPNPLYLRGSRRVGCWPCIMANKADLRLVSEDDSRVQVIERMEQIVGELSRQRNEARGETLERPPTFFQAATRNDDGERPCTPIREHLAWAKRARGKDHDDARLMFPGLNEGCLRWGLCDMGAES